MSDANSGDPNYGSGISASDLGGIQTAADAILPDNLSSSLDSGIALAQQYGILPPQVTQGPTPPPVSPAQLPSSAPSVSVGISKPLLIAGMAALVLFLVWKH